MTQISENFCIIGHRGAAGERLENSLDGFRHVLRLDVDAIEIDIREHDSELWVFHDRDLARLTRASGWFDDHPDIGQLELANGENVPTLKQVIDLTWGKIPLNIEIKAVDNLDLLLDLLENYPLSDLPAGVIPWNLISSFNHRALLELKRRGCRWPLAPIDSSIPLQLQTELDQLEPWSWHFDNDYLDFDLVQQLRDAGVPSFVFTVNDPERALELKGRGIAGIFTDYPSKMLQID